MISSRSFVKHAAVYGLAGLLVQAGGFVLLPLYTHCLTPADYGVLEVLSRMAETVGTCLMFGGFRQALLTFYQQSPHEAERRQVVATMLSLFGTTILLGGGLGAGAGRPAQRTAQQLSCTPARTHQRRTASAGDAGHFARTVQSDSVDVAASARRVGAFRDDHGQPISAPHRPVRRVRQVSARRRGRRVWRSSVLIGVLFGLGLVHARMDPLRRAGRTSASSAPCSASLCRLCPADCASLCCITATAFSCSATATCDEVGTYALGYKLALGGRHVQPFAAVHGLEQPDVQGGAERRRAAGVRHGHHAHPGRLSAGGAGPGLVSG